MQDEISFSSNLAKYGIGLFETLKVVEGEAVFLKKHLDRLYSSIKELNISFTIQKEVLKEKIEEFARDLDYHALRITVCDEGYNFSVRDISYTQKDYEEGYDLKISGIQRENNPLYNYKTTNYFTNIYARKQVQNQGYDEALFLDNNNFVLETTMANIFFIKRGKIYTPSNKLALLPGIMREQVILMAQELGIEVKGIVIEKPEISLFDFAFITNSLLGLMKVNQISGIKYKQKNNTFSQLKQKLSRKEMRS